MAPSHPRLLLVDALVFGVFGVLLGAWGILLYLPYGKGEDVTIEFRLLFGTISLALGLLALRRLVRVFATLTRSSGLVPLQRLVSGALAFVLLGSAFWAFLSRGDVSTEFRILFGGISFAAGLLVFRRLSHELRSRTSG
jgi:hypothetical protein